MLKLEELRKMDLKKLLAELAIIEKKLAESRFNLETGHSKESHSVKNYKKQKAQIKTIIGEKEVENVKQAIAEEAETK